MYLYGPSSKDDVLQEAYAHSNIKSFKMKILKVEEVSDVEVDKELGDCKDADPEIYSWNRRKRR